MNINVAQNKTTDYGSNEGIQEEEKGERLEHNCVHSLP